MNITHEFSKGGLSAIIRGHDPIGVIVFLDARRSVYVRCLENTCKSVTRKSNVYANRLVTRAIATVIRTISNTLQVCPTYSLRPR